MFVSSLIAALLFQASYVASLDHYAAPAPYVASQAAPAPYVASQAAPAPYVALHQRVIPYSLAHALLAHYTPQGQCTTIKYQKCVFPFIYNGRTYNHCTTDGNYGNYWCATSTYGDGRVVPGSWDACSTETCALETKVTAQRSITTYVASQQRAGGYCRTTSGPDTGRQCKFPFTFKGETYYSCGQWKWGGHGHGQYWCSTQTDHYGNHLDGQGFYGFCGVGDGCY